MDKFNIRPYDDYDACDTAETIEEAIDKRSKLDIVIVDENEMKLNDIDYEDIYDNINDYEYPYNYINRSDHSDLV